MLLADVKLVLRQFLNCQGRPLQRGVQVHVDDCPLLTRFYGIAGFTLMSSQGALRAAPRTAGEVVRCAGNVSWLNILMDQSLLVSRSQATATCALCRHAASEALPELGSTAPAWRPAEKPLCRELCIGNSFALELTPPQNTRNDRHVTTTLRAAHYACYTLLTHHRLRTLRYFPEHAR